MLPYKISYPTGGFDKIFHEINALLPKSKFLLLTDVSIARLYGDVIEQAGQILKGRMEKLVLENGEFSKSRKNKEKIEDYMFEKGFERKDALICLGGGVITDMGGFVAATYMRGIKFIQVPTTLLSMVDASVGSKTAVNSEAGKNLIGSIYDPALIVICVDFLKTIDDRNFSNGMAEIIKIGLIMDLKLFEFLKDKNVAYFRDPKNINDLVHIVKRAVDLKSEVVIQDRCEADLRKLLNYGHTIGHAVEFSLHEELLHGECVSIGIVLENELAILDKKFTADKQEIIKKVLQNYGLPIAKPEKVSVEKLMKYMQSDKKNQFSEIHFVLIEDLGKAYQKTFPFSAQLIKRVTASSLLVKESRLGTPTTPEVVSEAATGVYDLGFTALNGGVVRVKNVTGDSKFVAQLEKIGLKVVQEKDSVVLSRDLDAPLKPIDVNLKDQTDYFVTLAVILSQAEGISYIRGIESERGKTYDAIKATRKNLLKCGIFCRELEDGLEIHGKALKKASEKPQNVNHVVVKTHNDGRLAMSFALLGTYLANLNSNTQVIIEQKSCVVSAFPGFWEHMENLYSAKFEGYDEWKIEKPAKHPLDNSTVLVGLPGAGKSSLAAVAQEKFNCPALEAADAILAEAKKKDGSIKTYFEAVEKLGLETVQKIEAQCFEEQTFEFFNSKKKCIFSAGGGVVERESNRRLLQGYQNLVFVNRNRGDLLHEAAKYGDKHVTTYESALNNNYPLYSSLARYVFTYPKYFKDSILPTLISEPEYWNKVEESFKRFLRKMWSPERPPQVTDGSFFLAVDLEKLLGMNLSQARYLQTYDAIELRLDFFIERRKDLPYAEILEKLRDAISFVNLLVKVPLIMTIRTKPEGGAFTLGREVYNKFYKDLSKDLFFTYFDLEYCEKNLQFIDYFASKIRGNSYIILSKHYFDYKNDKEILKELDAMTSVTACDIYKVVLNEENDINILNQVRITKPLIKLKLGAKGKESRVKCNFLCPVYDELFDKPVAPGQLTRDEILRLRSQILSEPKLRCFYVIGENITLSVSPAMHNAAFSATGLHNHTYLMFNDKKVENIKKLLAEESFYGGSVTMPSKKDVVPLMTEVHGVAKVLGVVNTIVKIDNKLYGYNTDWYGIFKPIEKLVKKQGLLLENKYALVLGAGATAETAIYTLKQFGLIPIVYNRTYENAVKLVARHPGLIVVKDLKEIFDKSADLAIILSTTPGDADLGLPDELFKHNPICFDVSITPKYTAFLKKAEKNGCKNIVYGIEMLIYQGYMQHDIFTGKPCPRKVYKAAALSYYENLLKHVSK